MSKSGISDSIAAVILGLMPFACGIANVSAQSVGGYSSSARADAVQAGEGARALNSSLVTSTALLFTGVALRDGEVYVWGNRAAGQQGNGIAAVAPNAPSAKVLSLSNIVQVSGGVGHLLALDQDGDLFGWGQGIYGETGCAGVNVATPCKVMSDVVQVDAGDYFSMALTVDGEVFTWGQNAFGQLGNGSGRYGATPFKMDLGGERARLIGAAQEGAFVVTEAGHVWAWGDNESSGLGFQGVGYGLHQVIAVPTRVPSLDAYAARITHISGGNGWGEALLDDGRVIGWGVHAALGKGIRSTAVSNPEPQVILEHVAMLFTRYAGSLALTEGGRLLTWGQYGVSAFPMIYGDEPTVRATVHGRIVAIGGGREHLFYQTEDGKLYGVGFNDLFKLDPSRCCSPGVDWPGVEIQF